MIAIICTDIHGGISFNNRRVSKDRVVIEDIQNLTQGKKLFVPRSARDLFTEDYNVLINDSGIMKAKDDEYVFLESVPDPFPQGITKIIKYDWGREYPADVYLKVPHNFILEEERTLTGYSHEKIRCTALSRK